MCRTAYCFPSSAITERVRLNTALRSEKLRLCVSVELSVAVVFYMLWVLGGRQGASNTILLRSQFLYARRCRRSLALLHTQRCMARLGSRCASVVKTELQHHVLKTWCAAAVFYVGWCPTGRAQGQDDALWSDDDSGDEGPTDFKAAQAILESALPELDDGEEWATDSEEEFE